jgi:hypothetical protein
VIHSELVDPSHFVVPSVETGLLDEPLHIIHIQTLDMEEVIRPRWSLKSTVPPGGFRTRGGAGPLLADPQVDLAIRSACATSLA